MCNFVIGRWQARYYKASRIKFSSRVPFFLITLTDKCGTWTPNIKVCLARTMARIRVIDSEGKLVQGTLTPDAEKHILTEGMKLARCLYNIVWANNYVDGENPFTKDHPYFTGKGPYFKEKELSVTWKKR